MEWVKFVGGYYEIGYQLGYWWTKELRRIRQYPAGRNFMEKMGSHYKGWLGSGWSDSYLPLFSNVLMHFPEIIEEIAGMSQGARDGGMETSLLDMFGLAMGETDEQKLSCTSFVVKTKAGHLMAHNEEECQRFPLVCAKVSLKTKDENITFVSVSYPFQLLGSCVGMSKHLAFQGNSIGCMDQHEMLMQTWANRIPKTIFSRKLLEMKGYKEVVSLYKNFHSTLPNHQYLMAGNKAFSLEIRPILNPAHAEADKQLMVNPIGTDGHLQTNHFHHSEGIDLRWRWGSFCKESQLRWLMLEHYFRKHSVINPDGAMEVLKLMQFRYAKTTSASFVIQQTRNRFSMQGIYYFLGKPMVIKPVSLVA